MHGPDPASPHPWNEISQVCFIKNTIKGPNIEVGDCTYYTTIRRMRRASSATSSTTSPSSATSSSSARFCAIARG